MHIRVSFVAKRVYYVYFEHKKYEFVSQMNFVCVVDGFQVIAKATVGFWPGQNYVIYDIYNYSCDLLQTVSLLRLPSSSLDAHNYLGRPIPILKIPTYVWDEHIFYSGLLTVLVFL